MEYVDTNRVRPHQPTSIAKWFGSIGSMAHHGCGVAAFTTVGAAAWIKNRIQSTNSIHIAIIQWRFQEIRSIYMLKRTYKVIPFLCAKEFSEDWTVGANFPLLRFILNEQIHKNQNLLSSKCDQINISHWRFWCIPQSNFFSGTVIRLLDELDVPLFLPVPRQCSEPVEVLRNSDGSYLMKSSEKL